MISRRPVPITVARRHQPPRFMPAPPAAVCPKRSPSPLLISSPPEPAARDHPDRGTRRSGSPFRRERHSLGSDQANWWTRPVPATRRTGLPQGTPKRPDQIRFTSGHRHRACRSSSQEHRNDTHRSDTATAATQRRSRLAVGVTDHRWSAACAAIWNPTPGRICSSFAPCGESGPATG
jgi:hypothetical protein